MHIDAPDFNRTDLVSIASDLHLSFSLISLQQNLATVSLNPSKPPISFFPLSLQESKGSTLIERWQGLVAVWMNAQVHALLHYGYAPTDQNLRSFIVDFDALSRTKDVHAAELQKLSRQRWEALAAEAFGIDLSKETLPVEQARQVSSLLNLRMQSDAFMAKVDKAIVSV